MVDAPPGQSNALHSRQSHGESATACTQWFFYVVFEITDTHTQTDRQTGSALPQCLTVFQNCDVTPEVQWLVFCLSHFELRSLRAFAGTSATS